MTNVLPVNHSLKPPQVQQEEEPSTLLLITAAVVTLGSGIALGVLAAFISTTVNISTRDLASSVSSSATSSLPAVGLQVMNPGLMPVGTQRIRPIDLVVGLQVINPGLRQVGTQRI